MNSLWNTHRYRVIVGAPILFALLLNAGPVGLTSNTLSLTAVDGIAQESGELFAVTIDAHTHTPINATGAVLHFPPGKLTVEAVDTEGSIVSIWSEQPSFENDSGTLTLSGGILGETPNGWSGDGKVLRVLFRATAPGRARISIEKGLLLAADGRGTDVLTDRTNVVVYVRKPGTPSPDVNGDGRVSLADTNLVYLATFREYDAKYDFNLDQEVSWGDVLAHFYTQAE